MPGTSAPDDVSRDASPSPSAVLTALAAPGRNPADLTLPTAGTQATDPPGGSHEQPWWAGAKAFGASLWANTGGAVYNLATGEAGPALGERAYQKSVQRGNENPGVGTVVGLVGEDLIGAQAVEAIAGYDLATSQAIPGGLLEGGERSQRLAGGVAAFAGTVAGVAGGVARFTPLGPKMYPPKVPAVAPQAAPAAEAAAPMAGETASTATGKSIHKAIADARRASGEFDLVQSPITDKAGNPILVSKRVDLKTGMPQPGSPLQEAVPDAVSFERKLILDDTPLGRPIAKDRQEIIRFIKAYQQREGKLPDVIGISRYDPQTGQQVLTELYSPSDFLP